MRKPELLFLILGGFFITNALLAEFIGAKIFSLEQTLGLSGGLGLTIFGIGPLNLDMTAGVVLWPLVFVLTDIINEYYGRRGVRLLSFMAAGLILYAFFMVWVAMQLHPADFWRMRDLGGQQLDMDTAYNATFGQGLWIIAGSLAAFLIGQLVDVWVFHALRRLTGPKGIWVRATGSTLVSQLIDSFVVLFIAFYIGADWSLSQVLAIATVNYIYKFGVAIAMTPVLYAVHGAIDRFLGRDTAHHMMEEAARTS